MQAQRVQCKEYGSEYFTIRVDLYFTSFSQIFLDSFFVYIRLRASRFVVTSRLRSALESVCKRVSRVVSSARRTSNFDSQAVNKATREQMESSAITPDTANPEVLIETQCASDKFVDCEMVDETTNNDQMESITQNTGTANPEAATEGLRTSDKAIDSEMVEKQQMNIWNQHPSIENYHSS